ncbi:MAG: LLM class F420-dependent oxidoreductase [Actinomycetota bacterium]
MNGTVVPFWPDRPAAEALEVAAAAEERGFGELWIGEMATYDAFALAGAVAAKTARITITVGPLASGVRDPVSLALGVASVASIGRRPARLALGVSTPVVVRRWHGRPWRNVVAQLRETVRALRPLLDGQQSSFEGEAVRTSGFRLRLDPPRCQITVAAFAEGTVGVAAELADRMVVNLVTPMQAATLKAALAVRAAAAERPVPRLAAWVIAAVRPTKATLEQLRTSLVPYLAAPGYGEMFEAAGFREVVELARAGAHPKQLLAMIPARMPHAVGAIGDEETVRARLAEYRAAGVEDLAIVPATAGRGVLARTLDAIGDT